MTDETTNPDDMIPMTSTGPEGFRFIGLVHPTRKSIIASVWGWELEVRGIKAFKIDGALTAEGWRMFGFRTAINRLIFHRLNVAEVICTAWGSDEGGAMYHKAAGYRPCPNGEGVFLTREMFEVKEKQRAIKCRSLS